MAMLLKPIEVQINWTYLIISTSLIELPATSLLFFVAF